MKYKYAIIAALIAQLNITSAATTISGNDYTVDEGVNFLIGNNGASDFLINWTDVSGTNSNIADPKLILTAGETYTFERTSSAHPFAITDDSLDVAGSGSSLLRLTSDSAVITAATLTPNADFTAQPSGGSTISWTPTAADIGDYFYTCTVTGHNGMTGRIEVVAAIPEPSSSLLALLGLGFLSTRRKR